MEKFIESQYVNKTVKRENEKQTETVDFERKWEVLDPQKKQMRMKGFFA